MFRFKRKKKKKEKLNAQIFQQSDYSSVLSWPTDKSNAILSNANQ